MGSFMGNPKTGNEFEQEATEEREAWEECDGGIVGVAGVDASMTKPGKGAAAVVSLLYLTACSVCPGVSLAIFRAATWRSSS